MTAVLSWLTSVIVLASVYWPLEWAWPAREGQRWLRARIGTDFLFLTGQYLAWNGVALAFLLGARHGVEAWGGLGGLQAVVARQPFVLQVLEALLLGDLSVYWFHRASHRFELLWRFHAVHHTSEHVDWVAAHREHPVDGVLTQLAINLPGIVMGFDFATISSFVVFRGLWAIFIHSNVRLPLGRSATCSARRSGTAGTTRSTRVRWRTSPTSRRGATFSSAHTTPAPPATRRTPWAFPRRGPARTRDSCSRRSCRARSGRCSSRRWASRPPRSSQRACTRRRCRRLLEASSATPKQSRPRRLGCLAALVAR